MRIAIVDHSPVAGGIIRYGINLANAIAKFQGYHIDYFTHERNYQTNRDLFDDDKNLFRLRIIVGTKRRIFLNNKIDQILFKVLGFSREKIIKREIYRKTKNIDVVYFTSAHNSFYIPVKGKSFATMHDLNWNYLFGLPLFSKPDIENARRNFQVWLKESTIICSTNFIKSEIVRIFNPDCEISIVQLANLAKQHHIAPEVNDFSLHMYDIHKPYILFPGHLMPHKNHLSFINAFYKLQQDEQFKGKFILVLTGGGTDYFEYGIAREIGIERSDNCNFNIRGLGYVTNHHMDELIKSADLIVSPSLYEAGSGPAMDGWINGVPVLISNIPSHLEQMNFNNIDCFTFNPLDTNDIFEKLRFSLMNIEVLRKQSLEASKSLQGNSWDRIANAYCTIFLNELKKNTKIYGN